MLSPPTFPEANVNILSIQSGDGGERGRGKISPVPGFF